MASLKRIIQSLRLKAHIDISHVRYQLRILHTALRFRRDIQLYDPNWSIDDMMGIMFGHTSTGNRIFNEPFWYGQQRQTNHLVVFTDTNTHIDPRPLNEYVQLGNDVGIIMTTFEKRYVPTIRRSPSYIVPPHTFGQIVPVTYKPTKPDTVRRGGIIRGIMIHNHVHT